MASSVAGPLERAFATIPGITMMTSSSALGTTNIVMQFDLDRNIDGAALDVQSNISATLRKLPPQLPAPPSFQKLNPADSPILFIALVSKTLPLSKVDDYAEQVFAEQISQITGVAQVLVFGQQKFAVRVAVDPDAAAARGLTLDNVSNAVAAANSSTPVGALLGRRQNVTVDATGQMEHAAEYDNLVVAWRNGAPVRLEGDRQRLRLGREQADRRLARRRARDRAGGLPPVRRQHRRCGRQREGADSLLPVAAAAVGRGARAQRPLGLDPQSIDDVQFTLLLSIVLVVIVIFVFLKSAAATLIPALALPVSLIGTCAFMYVFGYSIDNISLLAITLSVGFVVDDAIVMLENITRHIEARHEAVRRGAEGLARDRLHHSVDHVLAGRGVHPGAADERRRRPRVPRIRGHDHGGDPGLRLRLADADADAVRAHPQRAQARRGRPGCSRGFPICSSTASPGSIASRSTSC